MKTRERRYLISLAVLMVVSATLLAFLEWGRRQNALAGQQTLDGSGRVLPAEDLIKRYRDPQELARLCACVRERFADVHERTLNTRHTRTTRLTEYDSHGKPTLITEIVEQVWYVGIQEKARVIGQRVLLDRKGTGATGKQQLPRPPANTETPFTKAAPEDVYTYHFDGVEEINGRPAGRIGFEPQTSSLTFHGWAWVALESGEPIRLQMTPVKLPPLVDRLVLLFDYDQAENGHNQARRMVLDGAGGFAFIARHLRVESELGNYRNRDE
jgi:hypothetical protein